MVEKVCEGCGKTFSIQYKSVARKQRFCSKTCIPRSVILRHKQKGMTEKECVICGKPFKVYHCNRDQKTCGIVCRGNHRAQVERAALQVRACVVCGTEFLIAKLGKRYSRHAGTESKLFCSRKCRCLARYRTTERTNKLSIEQASYLAGFIDGEGSIMLIGRKVGSMGLRVTITNTCYDVLAWIKDTCRVGAIYSKTRRMPQHRPTWHWIVNGEAAESLLQQLLLYLIVKREQARLALAFQSRLRDPSMKADREWQQDWKHQMQQLNRRGVGLKEDS